MDGALNASHPSQQRSEGSSFGARGPAVWWLAFTLGLVTVVPIWAMTPQDFDKFGAIKSLATLHLAFWVAVVVVTFLARGDLAGRLPRVPLVLVALLLLQTLAAALLSSRPEIGLSGNEVRYDGFFMAAANAVVFLGAMSLRCIDESRSTVRDLVRCMCAASLPVVAYGWMQAGGLDPVSWEGFREGFMRPFATLGNPIFLGAYCATVGIIALALGSLSSTRWRWAWSSLAGIHVGLLVLAATRASWIAFVAGLLVLLVLAARQKTLRRTMTPVAAMVLVAIGVVASADLVSRETSAPNQVTSAANSLSSIQGERNAGRLAIWEIACAVIRDHPVIGIGPDEMYLVFNDYRTQAYDLTEGEERLADKPHSSVLEYAVETGVPGAVLFVALVVWVLTRALWRQWRHPGTRDPIDLALALGALVYFVQSLVTVNAIGVDALWWTILGLSAMGKAERVSPAAGASFYPAAGVVLKGTGP